MIAHRSPSIRSFFRALIIVVLASIGVATVAQAQSSPTEFDKVGTQPNRDYLHLSPFEWLDSQNGNVMMHFPMLTLPGNAGRSLTFELTYNANSLVGPVWNFGIAGVPIAINNQAYPHGPISDTIVDTRTITPLLVMPDGSQKPTMFRDRPDSADATTIRWFVTSDLWKYDRDAAILYLPDGTTCIYDAASGRLYQVVDVDSNTVTLDWFSVPNQLTVVQSLGSSPSRTITFAINGWYLPTTMTYNGHQWNYVYDENGGALQTISPPIGPGWTFTYSAVVDGGQRLTEVRTPQGGTVTYTYQRVDLTPPAYRVLLDTRTVDDQNGVTGTWRVQYQYLESCECSPRTTVVTPSRTLVYEYGNVGVPHTSALIDGAWGLTRVTLQDGQGTAVQTETVTYTELPSIFHPDNFTFYATAINQRTVARNGRTYTTTFGYRSDAASFDDYHHVQTVAESGELTRTTTFTYQHPRVGSISDPVFVVGLQTSQQVDSDGETWMRCWTYNQTTGFRTSATDFAQSSCATAITTTYGPDAYGNTASETDGNGHTTSFTYKYGVLEDTNTPRYTIHRVINSDGTVASVSEADRITSFTYDDVMRLTTTQPPGGTNPTTITYDNANGQTVTRARGSSSVTTTFDGFGRTVRVQNSVGVTTRTSYDAEGHVTYEGYPFTGQSDVGVQVTYDVFDRVSTRTNPDGSAKTWQYGAGTVTITDEKQHQTIETWSAFGDPDSGRLASLQDAEQHTWTYGYHGLGQVNQVTAPDVTIRLWQYNAQNRLAQETHPESGQTNYTYDSAGNLRTKQTANGTTFTYTYDSNDRLTSIAASGSNTTTFTYESGSDNRTSSSDGTETTTFTYDSAGRIRTRQETIGAYVFTTTFGYDNNDNLTSITYPTGRTINYGFNGEHQIDHVYESAVGRDYASGITYHASGGMSTYLGGDLVQTTVAYDSARYWVNSITAGSLNLVYGRDPVGNVTTIADAHAGAQTYDYDTVDRLASAIGPWGATTYGYDAHGNRTTAGGTTYQYDAATLRLSQQGSNTFGYDNDGNVTSDSQATYTYTPEDWLRTATHGGITTAYLYDADGLRAQKSNQTDTFYYLRGLHGELLTEWKNPGPTGHVRDYVYAGSQLLAAIDKDNPNWDSACGGNVWPNGNVVHPVAITAAGGTATVRFVGSACRRVSILATKTSSASLGCNWTVTLKNAVTNQAVGTAGASCNGSKIFVDPITLPVSGSYDVVIKAGSTSTGTANVSIWDVVDIFDTLLPDGTPVAVNFTTPGQVGRLRFSGAALERVSAMLTAPANSFPSNVSVRIRRIPTGTVFGGTTLGSSGGWVEPTALTVADDYELFIDPIGEYIANATIKTWKFFDVAASLTPNAAAATPVSVPVPGQRALVTFTGDQNYRISAYGKKTFGTLDSCGWYLELWNGSMTTQLSSAGSGSIIGFDWTTIWIDGSNSVPLSATATYVLVVDPIRDCTGNADVNVYESQDVTGTITPNGPPVAFTISVPGQRALFTFTGTGGDLVSALGTVTSGSFGDTWNGWNVYVKNAAMTDTFASWIASGTTDFADSNTVGKALVSDGSYVVIVDPGIRHTGEGTVQLWTFRNVTGSITPNASSPVHVPLSAPGQKTRLTFTATGNDRVSVVTTVTSGDLKSGWTTRVQNTPWTTTYASGTGNSGLTTLLADNSGDPNVSQGGSYVIDIDPAGTGTGEIDVSLYEFADVTASATVNGDPVAISTSLPAQNGIVTFSGTSGQQVTVRVTGNTMGWTAVILRDPSNGYITGTTLGGSNFTLSTVTLTTSGTFKVTVDPSGTASGSINVAITSP